MGFTRKKYETDEGTVLYIRLSDEMATAAGTEATGAVSETGLRVSARASKRKQNSLTARAHIFSIKTSVSGGRNLVRYLRVPKLTKTAYETIPTAKLNYKEEDWDYLVKSPEG